MEFVKASDYGGAPIIPVDGVARIERVGPNKIRVSFYTEHPGRDGTPEYRLACQLEWDRSVWTGTMELFNAARRTLTEPPKGPQKLALVAG